MTTISDSHYYGARSGSPQSYNYLLFGFAGFSQSFSDMAQNIMSATYKGVGGGVGWMVG